MQIAIIGDVHKAWDHEDVAYFNQSDYDLILIVGDLPGRSHRGLLDVGRAISALSKRTLFLPGNHDAVSIVQLLAEVKQHTRLIERSGRGMEKNVDDLAEALSPVELVGFSGHRIGTGPDALDVIACRPHSMGGDYLAYRPYLKRRFGVGSFDESAQKLKELIDAAGTNLLFLAHNGPTGLGGERADIFGCDFRRHGGDFGDADLKEALDYARGAGKKAIAVAAGHMHYSLKGGGGPRIWCALDGETMVLNAARVPRIFLHKGERFHHHVRIVWDGASGRFEEVLVQADGTELVAAAKPGQISATMAEDFPQNCRS